MPIDKERFLTIKRFVAKNATVKVVGGWWQAEWRGVYARDISIEICYKRIAAIIYHNKLLNEEVQKEINKTP